MAEKTEAMCDLIVAFMKTLDRDVRHGEIGDMMRETAPDEAERFGFYVWHLHNRATIERVRRGIYRLARSTP